MSFRTEKLFDDVIKIDPVLALEKLGSIATWPENLGQLRLDPLLVRAREIKLVAYFASYARGEQTIVDLPDEPHFV